MQLINLNILISYETKQNLCFFAILQYFDYDLIFFLTTRLMLTLLPLIPKGLEPRNVAQWVRALASHAKGLVFKFQPRQTQVVKTDSKSSTAKRSAISVIAKVKATTGPLFE